MKAEGRRGGVLKEEEWSGEGGGEMRGEWRVRRGGM